MSLGLIFTVFGIFCFLFGIMAIGVVAGRSPITGSCGGIGRVDNGSSECAICGGDSVKCEEAINQKSVVGTSVGISNTVRSRLNLEKDCF